MPIEIRRFGVGHRRLDGPPRTSGVADQVITSDDRGTVTELAFARGARMEPYASPNTSWLIVIEGGGWVGVGEERTRIAAGEAVIWPADVPHAAWTDHSQMRAFIVEFPPAATGVTPLLEGTARSVDAGEGAPADPAVVRLRDEAVGRPRRDPDAGEPA